MNASARKECNRWKKAISRVMPEDFKDWHENSDIELPEVAAWVIQNLRFRLKEAEDRAVRWKRLAKQGATSEVRGEVKCK